MRGIFVLGSDTDVGKTYFAQRLLADLVAHGRRMAAYKPVASGPSGSSSDVAQLHAAAGLVGYENRVGPQQFSLPVAPPIAAEAEGTMVDEQLLMEGYLAWEREPGFEAIVVEGAGGCLSPISRRTTVLDLAATIRLPVVLVAANRLGCINHILLSVAAIAARDLPLWGVVLNQLPHSKPSLGPASAQPSTDYLTDHSIESNAELLTNFFDGPTFTDCDTAATALGQRLFADA